MPEFTNPQTGADSSVSAVVVLLILMAITFLGAYRFSGSRRHAAASATQQPARTGTAALDMNILERAVFVPLASLHTELAPRTSGAWGWAIVLLTVAVNLLVLPLRVAGIRSGRRMQRLQPALDAIRARYRDVGLADPRRAEMSAEISDLQKRNGINPFGGCLPLLLQMPLLFAFFGMLRKAPALHGAGWLWLYDLSSPDPLHVLPLLMIVSQLLVQWYTPSPGIDVKQQRLMACVTAAGFAFVSWHYAAGVAIYALTGSLFSLGSQAVLNLRH